ncbi:MAG: ATP-binding cassette domain-containing protein, partial [Candidatus Methylomirabilales bacterium]
GMNGAKRRMSGIAIRAEGLTKDYRTGFWHRRVRVLHDLNLEVQAGEVFGFLGPNGAGKTTTLKLLTGLIHPTAGSATVLGEPAGSVGVKARIGFLPENPHFYDYLTGAEYLDYCAALTGLPRTVRRDRVGALLERVGLSAHGALQLRKYSKGMLQRIGLAQALINEPAVIFLDEPMSGLDPLGRKEIRDLILHLREQGRTVFFSTHIIPDVEMVCDRVGIILAGRLAAVGRVEELLASPLEQIEVTASGLPSEAEAALAASSVTPPVRSGDRILLAVKGEEDLGQVLRAILQTGGRVHSVVPHRRTLEEVFLDRVREGSR